MFPIEKYDSIEVPYKEQLLFYAKLYAKYLKELAKEQEYSKFMQFYTEQFKNILKNANEGLSKADKTTFLSVKKELEKMFDKTITVILNKQNDILECISILEICIAEYRYFGLKDKSIETIKQIIKSRQTREAEIRKADLERYKTDKSIVPQEISEAYTIASEEGAKIQKALEKRQEKIEAYSKAHKNSLINYNSMKSIIANSKLLEEMYKRNGSDMSVEQFKQKTLDALKTQKDLLTVSRNQNFEALSDYNIDMFVNNLIQNGWQKYIEEFRPTVSL